MQTLKGELTYLHMYLDKLLHVERAVKNFLARESKLKLLVNDAGLINPPPHENVRWLWPEW